MSFHVSFDVWGISYPQFMWGVSKIRGPEIAIYKKRRKTTPANGVAYNPNFQMYTAAYFRSIFHISVYNSV